MDSEPSYRELKGFVNPPAATILELKFTEGLKYYLHWPGCNDHEDIVQGWFSTRKKAEDFAVKNGWSTKYIGK